VAAKLDQSESPSIQLVRRDSAHIAHNMRVAANGPVSLTTDGKVSIYDIDVKYCFFAMEKKGTTTRCSLACDSCSDRTSRSARR
jgi:hypothetical protein